MKLLIPALALIAAALVFLACKGGGGGLPKEMPDDFEVRYSQSGGMMPVGLNYFIRNDTVRVESWMDQTRNTWNFATDPADFANLWAVMLDQQAARIQTHEEMVYDRGGDGFAFNANGKNYDISNGGMSFVEKKWAENYRAIVDKIHQMVVKGLEPFQVDYQVSISPDIPANLNYFYLSIRERSLVNWDSTSGKAFPSGDYSFRELSGNHLLEATTKSQGQYKTAELPVELVSGANPHWQVTWQDGEILITEAK